MNSLAYLSNQALVQAVADALKPGNLVRRKIEDRMRSLKSEAQNEQRNIRCIQRTSERGFRVINRDILYRVFMPFVDQILLNWEILADMMIDDLITEEVFNLNSLESRSKPIPAKPFTQEKIEKIEKIEKVEKVEKVGKIEKIEKQDAKAILDFVKECKLREEALLYKYS